MPGYPERPAAEPNCVSPSCSLEERGDCVGFRVALDERNIVQRHPDITPAGGDISTPSGVPRFDRGDHLARHRIDALYGAVALVQDPDGPLTRRQEARRRAKRGRLDKRVRASIDLVELAEIKSRYPDKSIVEDRCGCSRSKGQRNGRFQRSGRRPETREHVAPCRDPDRSRANADASLGAAEARRDDESDLVLNWVELEDLLRYRIRDPNGAFPDR